MDESVHIEVAKSDFRASRFPEDSRMRVCESCAVVGEEIIKEVILYVGACEGLAISVFDGNLLLARYLCTVRR